MWLYLYFIHVALGGRNHRHNGIVNAKPIVELNIVDVPGGLPIPTLLDLTDVIPP